MLTEQNEKKRKSQMRLKFTLQRRSQRQMKGMLSVKFLVEKMLKPEEKKNITELNCL